MRARLAAWGIQAQHRLRESRGQGLVEYTLILALASVVAIGAVTSLGQTIVTKLFTLATAF